MRSLKYFVHVVQDPSSNLLAVKVLKPLAETREALSLTNYTPRHSQMCYFVCSVLCPEGDCPQILFDRFTRPACLLSPGTNRTVSTAHPFAGAKSKQTKIHLRAASAASAAAAAAAACSANCCSRLRCARSASSMRYC